MSPACTPAFARKVISLRFEFVFTAGKLGAHPPPGVSGAATLALRPSGGYTSICWLKNDLSILFLRPLTFPYLNSCFSTLNFSSKILGFAIRPSNFCASMFYLTSNKRSSRGFTNTSLKYERFSGGFSDFLYKGSKLIMFF